MIKSPLKWAGGKTRVLPELLKHLPKADCLIEPFVGLSLIHIFKTRPLGEPSVY